ncbi:hypothetical protein PAPHI01_1385 [Pancytospora philotis]|nr:hypothetical protein PAPHI01_1385 [Pancytospora philotis]
MTACPATREIFDESSNSDDLDGWGSVPASKQPADEAPVDQKRCGARPPAPLYQCRSSSSTKSSTHLDFLDDDDDSPFVQKREAAPRAVRSQPNSPQPRAPVPEKKRVMLFDSSESDDLPFTKPEVAAPVNDTKEMATDAAPFYEPAVVAEPCVQKMPVSSSRSYVATQTNAELPELNAAHSVAVESLPVLKAEAPTQSPSAKAPQHSYVRQHSAMKESMLRYRPLVHALGSSVVLYRRNTAVRYVGGAAVEKAVNVFEVKTADLPDAENILIKDEELKRLMALSVSATTPLETLESALGICGKSLFSSDVVLSRDSLNAIAASAVSSAEQLCECVAKGQEDEAFVCEYLKAKQGLMVDSAKGSAAPIAPGYFKLVVQLNNPAINRMYLGSQAEFIRFFIVFYKLSLVTIMDYANRFYNNPFYVAVLQRINRGEDLTLLYSDAKEASSKGWSVRSMLDFGISKILSVDAVPAQEEPRGNVIVGSAPPLHSEEPVHSAPGPHKGWPAQPSAVSQEVSEAVAYGFNGADHEDAPPKQNSEILQIFGEDDDLDLFGAAKPVEPRPFKAEPSRAKPVEATTEEANAKEALGSVPNSISAQQEVDKDANEEPKAAPDNSTLYKDKQNATSSSDLASEGTKAPIYKTKFSKSFADIFSLGTATDNSKVDVGCFVDDVTEGDKPMLIKEYEEDTKSSIFNMFGMFKKKERGQPARQEQPVQPRPARGPIQAPSRDKERTVLKGIYANKKSAALEIPGAPSASTPKQAFFPNRTAGSPPSSPDAQCKDLPAN